MPDVLIVDTNARDCERITDSLRDCNCVVCHTGVEAKSAIRKGTFVVALVLWELDGEVTGPELVKWLHRECPGIKIITTDGRLDTSRASLAKKMGAKKMLFKPLDCKQLTETVHAILAPRTEPPLFDHLRTTLIGESEAFLESLRELARVIPNAQETILLTGEPGTGKELFAMAIHDHGSHSSHPRVSVNMANLPRELIESALFGHEKGAFTHATELQRGAFEICGSGTLFCDEIGEFEPKLQAKLLRAVEQREFQRLGGNKIFRFEGRLVFATNKQLVKAVAEGSFRPDLYDRISALEVKTVPLRERDKDIQLLVPYLLRSLEPNRELKLSREVWTILEGYPFYGNVRELKNVLQFAIAQCDGARIEADHLPLATMGERLEIFAAIEAVDNEFAWPERLLNETYEDALVEFQRAFGSIYLPRVLDNANQHIGEACKRAGFKDRKTFHTKWEKAGLPPLKE